jgi:methyltransferase
MNSTIIFSGLVGLLILQRLWELQLSQQNIRALLENGGREFFPGHYPVMVTLHSSWILSMLVEIWWLEPDFSWNLALPALILVIIGQGLRYHAIFTLGTYWNTKIVLVPGKKVLCSGLYRYLRHPNYLGVVLEIACFPLLHYAIWTSIFFSISNALLLFHRIRCEETALTEHCAYQ